MRTKEVKVKVSPRGIGFGGMLFLLFLTLKLTGTIGWSWWWVTAPLWGPFAAVIAVLLVAAIFALVFALIAALIK